VTTIGDILDPADRRRLQQLGEPENDPDLAAAAHRAAEESSGIGRAAWFCCATALECAETPADARTLLADTIHGEQLRTLALACLATLTGAGRETP